jgi:hypothetical protein
VAVPALAAFCVRSAKRRVWVIRRVATAVLGWRWPVVEGSVGPSSWLWVTRPTPSGFGRRRRWWATAAMRAAAAGETLEPSRMLMNS